MTKYDEADELLKRLTKRRTKRAASGPQMPAKSPLQSTEGESARLTSRQELYLACAGVGITGKSLGDLPYQDDALGGGNIIARWLSRTSISPDAVHCTSLFIVNDDGVRFVKRPQNLDAKDLDAFGTFQGLREWFGVNRTEPPHSKAEAQREQTEAAESIRRVGPFRPGTERLDIPREPPHVPTFNAWLSNQPGTTYFVPVMELSELYLSALFGGLNKHAGYYLLDDRNNLSPAGLSTFTKDEGGQLEDNAHSDRVFTLDALDTSVAMFASVELGAILQNMSLMAQALGVGGWPHYASGTEWLKRLGFDHVELNASRVLGLNPELAKAMQFTDRDRRLWSPLGLSIKKDNVPDEHLIKPYCPPYYPSMEAAVHAFVEHKFGAKGSLVQEDNTPWKRTPRSQNRTPVAKSVLAKIPRYTEQQIDAAIEHCTYVYERYGRFPAKFGPVVTLTAFQAHKLDRAFYTEQYDSRLVRELDL